MLSSLRSMLVHVWLARTRESYFNCYYSAMCSGCDEQRRRESLSNSKQRWAHCSAAVALSEQLDSAEDTVTLNVHTLVFHSSIEEVRAPFASLPRAYVCYLPAAFDSVRNYIPQADIQQ